MPMCYEFQRLYLAVCTQAVDFRTSSTVIEPRNNKQIYRQDLFIDVILRSIETDIKKQGKTSYIFATLLLQRCLLSYK